MRAYRYSRSVVAGDSAEEYLVVVNERPRLSVETVLHDVAGERLRGVQVDVLNEGQEAAFTGHVELSPYESRLIVLGGRNGDGGVVEDAADAGSAGSPGVVAAASGGKGVEMNGPWTLSFAAPLAYPSFTEVREVARLDGQDMGDRYFDRFGTFRYETTFELDVAHPLMVLDLGKAYEMLEVSVDGAAVGSRIAPPYRFELENVPAGTHRLTVDVTNTLDKDASDFFSLTEPRESSGLFSPVVLRA